MLASRDEWVRGKWNAADVMISAMRITYIGPRTSEYGVGEEYGNEEGMKIINHLADREGLETEKEGGKKEEWTAIKLPYCILQSTGNASRCTGQS